MKKKKIPPQLLEVLDDYGVLLMTPSSKMRDIGKKRNELLKMIEEEINGKYDIN